MRIAVVLFALIAVFSFTATPVTALQFEAVWTEPIPPTSGGTPYPIVEYKIYGCEGDTFTCDPFVAASWTELSAFDPATACATTPCTEQFAHTVGLPGVSTTWWFYMTALVDPLAPFSPNESGPSSTISRTVSEPDSGLTPPGFQDVIVLSFLFGDIKVIAADIGPKGKVRIARSQDFVAGDIIVLAINRDRRLARWRR